MNDLNTFDSVRIYLFEAKNEKRERSREEDFFTPPPMDRHFVTSAGRTLVRLAQYLKLFPRYGTKL